MINHAVLWSLTIVAIVALHTVICSQLQLIRQACRQPFLKSLKLMPAPMIQENIRCVRIDAERAYSQLRTVDHGDRGCFAIQENRSMCLPPPLVQPYITNSLPAPSREIQHILGAYVIIKGVVSRGVFAKSKRPRMSDNDAGVWSEFGH